MKASHSGPHSSVYIRARPGTRRGMAVPEIGWRTRGWQRRPHPTPWGGSLRGVGGGRTGVPV